MVKWPWAACLGRPTRSGSPGPRQAGAGRFPPRRTQEASLLGGAVCAVSPGPSCRKLPVGFGEASFRKVGLFLKTQCHSLLRAPCGVPSPQSCYTPTGDRLGPGRHRVPRAASAGVGVPGQEPHNMASPGGRSKRASAPLGAARKLRSLRDAPAPSPVKSQEVRPTYLQPPVCPRGLPHGSLSTPYLPPGLPFLP